MTKLIDKFLSTKSDADRAKLQKYLNKHSMAFCLASPEQIEILRTHGFAV